MMCLTLQFPEKPHYTTTIPTDPSLDHLSPSTQAPRHPNKTSWRPETDSISSISKMRKLRLTEQNLCKVVGWQRLREGGNWAHFSGRANLVSRANGENQH